jgi:LysM repeat protein
MGVIMKKLVLFFLFVTTMSYSLFSQEEKKKEEYTVHTINGREYFIHVVEKGNTLYAISRKYAITVEALKKENPRLSQALVIGDRLLIPLSEVKRKDLDESPEIDGNYLIHEVQKKNTLYSLAKEYHVEINDLIVANPEIEEGLKKGMKIKIPVAQIKSEADEEEYIIPAEASPYVTHRVSPKETLYSLSKKYDVSIDSLKKVNNGLPEGLKSEQLINIPILKKIEEDSTVVLFEPQFDSTAVKQSYSVSLLLPFYLDKIEETEDSSYTEGMQLRRKLLDDAKYGIEFYQGFKIAADSLVKMGMHLELNIFDTANDSAKVKSLLKDSLLKKSDLLVGPLYLDEFLQVADFAKQHEINIVSPVKQSNRILLGNNFVSKVATSAPVRLKFLGNYMADSLRKGNIVMIYPDHFEDRRRAEQLKKIYYQNLEVNEDTTWLKQPIKEVLWDTKELFRIIEKLDTSVINNIVVPSEDQAFVTQLLTQLNMKEDYDFKVFGLSVWEGFDNIEIDYLHNLHVHLVVSEFIDPSQKEVKDFEQEFMDTYGIAAEKFSYLGFDVGMYYLSLLHEYGSNFGIMFLGLQQEQLGRKFEFFKTGIESGYENHSVYMIKYEDFEKKRVY